MCGMHAKNAAAHQHTSRLSIQMRCIGLVGEMGEVLRSSMDDVDWGKTCATPHTFYMPRWGNNHSSLRINDACHRYFPWGPLQLAVRTCRSPAAIVPTKRRRRERERAADNTNKDGKIQTPNFSKPQLTSIVHSLFRRNWFQPVGLPCSSRIGRRSSATRSALTKCRSILARPTVIGSWRCAKTHPGTTYGQPRPVYLSLPC